LDGPDRKFTLLFFRDKNFFNSSAYKLLKKKI